MLLDQDLPRTSLALSGSTISQEIKRFSRQLLGLVMLGSFKILELDSKGRKIPSDEP